jgi:ABC-2 type transport system ATP-binding protein
VAAGDGVGAILSVEGLRKAYGATVAVDGVSFHVAAGEVVGLLGPNGAGKTTTINAVLGVLAADSGTILVDGLAVPGERAKALPRMNFAAVHAPLPGNLTVEENLRVFGLLYGVTPLRARVEALLAQFGLLPFRRVRCGALSSGEQTRAGLAKAMLNRPRLLLLDEPTASLDPATARETRALIRAYLREEGGCALWASHNMREVEEVCDRVLFLSKGRILLEGRPSTLPAEHGRENLEELFVAVAREPLSLGGE